MKIDPYYKEVKRLLDEACQVMDNRGRETHSYDKFDNLLYDKIREAVKLLDTE